MVGMQIVDNGHGGGIDMLLGHRQFILGAEGLGYLSCRARRIIGNEEEGNVLRH